MLGTVERHKDIFDHADLLSFAVADKTAAPMNSRLNAQRYDNKETLFCKQKIDLKVYNRRDIVHTWDG